MTDRPTTGGGPAEVHGQMALSQWNDMGRSGAYVRLNEMSREVDAMMKQAFLDGYALGRKGAKQETKDVD